MNKQLPVQTGERGLYRCGVSQCQPVNIQCSLCVLSLLDGLISVCLSTQYVFQRYCTVECYIVFVRLVSEGGGNMVVGDGSVLRKTVKTLS